MKPFLIFLGLAVAGVLGYMNEPSLRYQITGVMPKMAGQHGVKPTVSEFPPVDLASLTPEQLPEKVTLRAEVLVTDTASELTMKIPAGNRVKLVRIEGANVVVSPGEATCTGVLAIASTDLMEQLATHPVAAQKAPSDETPIVSEPVMPTTEDSTESVPESTGESVPEATGEVALESTGEAVLEPAPEETPAPVVEAFVPPVGKAGAVLVKIMQTSIRNGQLKEFAFNQVRGWKPEANETVDGVLYQTGVAAYKAETVFGTKTILAKALIKNGKVARWIWPKSGIAIK